MPLTSVMVFDVVSSCCRGCRAPVVERGQDLGAEATTVGYGVAVGPGPLADLVETVSPLPQIGGGGTLTSAGARGLHLACAFDEPADGRLELGDVLTRQIDLVSGALHRERERALRRRAVDVIDELAYYLLRHSAVSSRRRGMFIRDDR